MIKVIGIAGYARCGKDTFVGIAKNILAANNYRPIRVAFADKLKEETESMLKANNFKTTVYTEDSESKKLIRPLFVWWGCQRRYESNGGLYWVCQVDDQLRKLCKDLVSNGEPTERVVAMVSDVRFANEARWVHEQWGGKVIHLKRYVIKEVHDVMDGFAGTVGIPTKVYDPAPNEEESKNDPLVQEMADFRIEWESKGKHTAETAIKDSYLQGVVLKTLNDSKIFSETLLL